MIRLQKSVMGSKERMDRHKEQVRRDIMDAALQIGKESGWNALSMRKIADAIEYTAPLIYEYFRNKDDLLRELTRDGFVLLTKHVSQALARTSDPLRQLPAMWTAYWNFAISEHQRYQIMFGIEFICCDFKKTLPEAQASVSLFLSVIQKILHEREAPSELALKYYYTFWSTIHGLISINHIRDDVPEKVSMQVLTGAIDGIMNMLVASVPGEST